MPLRSRFPLAATAAVLIALAAADCSSASPQPQVAALPASTAPGSASTAPAGAPSASTPGGIPTSSRPRERLDETTSQLNSLAAPWVRCIAAHGGGNNLKSAQADDSSKAGEAAAQAACAPLKPLPPWQYDPANPQALGFVQRVVACLHAHGVQYAQVQNSPGQVQIEIALGGPKNDQASINGGMQLIPVCDQQLLRENASSTSP